MKLLHVSVHHPSPPSRHDADTAQDIIPPRSSFNKQFIDLLHKIFVYDPKTRINAKKALQHPWFKETIKDDGTEAFKIKLQKESEREHINLANDDDDDEGYAE